MKFDYFNVPETVECSGDNLVVFDIDGSTSAPGPNSPPPNAPIATLCGNVQPLDIESEGNELLIAYRSYSHLSSSHHGFQYVFNLF